MARLPKEMPQCTGVTHYSGCDCHEAAHAAEVGRLTAEVERLRAIVAAVGSRVYASAIRNEKGAEILALLDKPPPSFQPPACERCPTDESCKNFAWCEQDCERAAAAYGEP